jgi:hypothetical protein
MPADPYDSAAVDAYITAYESYSQAVMANQEAVGAHYEAVQALADSTRAGGEQSVAVWQSLLVTAGIAVEGPDGKPLEIEGDAGFGWAMSDAELRLHAVLATATGGVRLIDIADALGAGIDIPGPELAQAIVNDLTMIEDPGFSKVLSSLQPDVLFAETGAKAIDEVVLSWASLGLVMRRLSAELAASDTGATGHDDSAASTGAGPTIALASFSGPVKAAAGKRACEVKTDNPWVAELVNQVNKTHTFVFDQAMGYIDDAMHDNTRDKATINGTIGLARLVAAMYTMLAKAAALDATFTLDNAPLVRTKNTKPGEVRDLTLKFEFAEDSWEDIRGCMNLFLAPFGLDVPGSQAGVAENIDVQLYSDRPAVVRIGDGKGGNADVTKAVTDSGGTAKFRVSGAPQADILPEVAEAEDIDVSLRAVSNLGANDFFKDLASLPWDALDAAGTGGLSVVPIVLSKMKWITQTGSIPVRDWNLEADFEATLVASLETRSATHWLTSGGCGHDGQVITRSSEYTGSIASDTVAVSAILLSNPDGNLGDQAAVFMPTGQDFEPVGDGKKLELFRMPGHYTATLMHNNPAVGALPPQKFLPPVGGDACAEGYGTHVPPPPDCGQRSYSATLEVMIPAPRKLYVSSASYEGEAPWQHCPGPAAPIVPDSDSCESPLIKGGAFPSTADVFDSSKQVIEVSGSLTCRSSEDGFMESIEYHWTLVLCRIVDGKSAC